MPKQMTSSVDGVDELRKEMESWAPESYIGSLINRVLVAAEKQQEVIYQLQVDLSHWREGSPSQMPKGLPYGRYRLVPSTHFVPEQVESSEDMGYFERLDLEAQSRVITSITCEYYRSLNLGEAEEAVITRQLLDRMNKIYREKQHFLDMLSRAKSK